MSSFFTTPASQKKRKLAASSSESASKRRNAPRKIINSKSQNIKRRDPNVDESVSGSSSEDENSVKPTTAATSPPLSEEYSTDENETGAEKRLRLAEKYLENIKGTIDGTGFDAEEIDRDLIAERLQEDVAETEGLLHKHVAASLDFGAAVKSQFRNGGRGGRLTVTGVATCEPYVYTVTKDMNLVKWQLPEPLLEKSAIGKKKRRKLLRQQQEMAIGDNKSRKQYTSQKPVRRRPLRLLSTYGLRSQVDVRDYMYHTAPILCVAASPTGQFVVTGGADRKMIVWNASDLKPLRVFTQHRDAVTSLAFRRGTNQLYSASKDRTIKTWSLNELAYVETLFGHQDEVLDLCAGMGERCFSIGGRDRTVRLWKVIEETQLVFRGGGGGAENKRRKAKHVETVENGQDEEIFSEGSIDCVALVDEETFVTGSDNGNICLWNVRKKKPVFTVRLAHGVDPPLKPEEASAEADPAKRMVAEPCPRWITALATLEYSDIVVSGSWDSELRVWKVGDGKRSLEALGIIGGSGDGEPGTGTKGVVNSLSVFERGGRGRETLGVAVGVGTECRLGGWKRMKDARNRAILFEVPRIMKQIDNTGLEKSRDVENGEVLNFSSRDRLEA